MRRFLVLLCAVCLVLPGSSVAQTAEDAYLGALLSALHTEKADTYGLVVEDLRTGERRVLNEDRVFASGSVYKLALAWEVLRRVDLGLLRMDDALSIEAADVSEVEPWGGFAPGETPTLREAMGAMLSVSSNSAAHAFLRLLGRPTFNESMLALGLSRTRVPEEAGAVADEARTSARDVARILRLLASGEGLSLTSQDELKAALSVGGWPDALRDALPSEVLVLDKTGNLDQASNVGALLIGPRSTVVLVVLDHDVDPGDARAVIAQLGLAAYFDYLRSTD